MDVTKKIKMALAYKGISEAELARLLGTSPSAFNQRMKAGKFTTAQIEQIAEALGAEYSHFFKFKDGTTI